MINDLNGLSFVFLECSGHLFSCVESPHVLFEVGFLEGDLAVSLQQADHCDLALKQS